MPRPRRDLLPPKARIPGILEARSALSGLSVRHEIAKELGALCDICPCNECTPVVPPQVIKPKRKRQVLLLESPAYNEVRTNEYIAGATGELLDEDILPKVDCRRSDYHVANALLCWPPQEASAANWNKAIECCRHRVHREMARVRPKVILAAGGRATQSVIGDSRITKLIGAPVAGSDFFVGGRKKGVKVADFTPYTIIPSFHPASAFDHRKPQNLPVLRIFFDRARRFSEGSLKPWRWPKRRLHPDAAGIAALKDILAEAHKGVPFSIDIENKTTAKVITAIGFSNWGFTKRHRTVSVPWDGYHPGNGYERVQPLQGGAMELVLALLYCDALKVLQNGISDRVQLAQWKGVMVAGPFWDTLLAHQLIAPELSHALSFIAAVDSHADRWKEKHKADLTK